MVSFRVSPEEYQNLCQACSAQGLQNVSELARVAMQVLIQGNKVPETFDEQLQDLRARIQHLSVEFERLSRHVEFKPCALFEPASNSGSLD